MTKMEKVIAGITACKLLGQNWDYCVKRGCPYADKRDMCLTALHKDALAMLKKQAITVSVKKA